MTSASPNAPHVSVVVPVFNAAKTLTDCVEALLGQSYPRDAYETVFVDNGSGDDSLDILESFKPDIHVCTESRRGPSAARNAGVRAAKYELIAFTDADCIPEPDWLSNLVEAAHDHPEATLIGGPIVAWRPSSFAARYSERLFDQERAVRAPRFPYVISANLCVRREHLERVGMFDETLLTGEDVDLSYRMASMVPAPFVFAETAVVGHVNPDTLAAIVGKGIEHGRSSGRLADRHAELIGVTALGRLANTRRYARILNNIAEFSLGSMRRVAGVEEPEEEWLRPLYEAAFMGAKQLGVAAHLVESAWEKGSPEAR